MGYIRGAYRLIALLVNGNYKGMGNKTLKTRSRSDYEQLFLLANGNIRGRQIKVLKTQWER